MTSIGGHMAANGLKVTLTRANVNVVGRFP